MGEQSNSGAGYASAQVEPSRYTWVLLAIGLYQAVGAPSFVYQLSAGILILLGIALVRRWRRRSAYALVAVLAVLATGEAVFVEANGPQDAQANRDDAVEYAANAFAAGVNPWTQSGTLGNVTSGPTSVLIATPFVSVFGRVNELTFAFWLGFLGFLAWGDFATKNGSFLDLALFYFLGQFEIMAAQYWSLEELYYPHLLMAGAFLAVRRGRHALAGAFLAGAMLGRSNYAFLVVAFVAWVSRREHDRHWLRPMAAGAGLGTAVVLVPIVLRCGFGALEQYLRNTSAAGGQPLPTAIITFPARGIAAILGPGAGSAITAVTALAAVFWIVRRLPPISNPFPYVALAAFVAHTAVWYSGRPGDYTLMFVIPALFAVAWRKPPEAAKQVPLSGL